VRPVRSSRLRALLPSTLGVALAASLLAAVPGAAAAAPATASSSSLQEQVQRLSAQIEAVGAELAKGALEYEAAEHRLAELTQRQFAARADSEALVTAEAQSRNALQGLARAAYKGGVPPMVTALLSGNPRAVSNLAYVQRSVNRVGAEQSEVARDLAEQQAGAGQAVVRADGLRRQALAQRQALERTRREVAAKTVRLTAELHAAGEQLAKARAAEDAAARAKAAAARAAAARAVAAAAGLAVSPAGDAGGGLCGPASGAGEVNGFLSEASLCPLAMAPGHRLRTDAARAFDALSRARLAATGAPLCVTDSYRSYAAQVDVFRRKPELAATPGRSQHGWGLAVDLCGGVQTFGSEAHGWMQQNGPTYGWIHPAWARPTGSKPEAWHWEYVGIVRARR
jgi:hypothetical protein